ncbi:MAG: DUF1553 domain-containing protein [Planctomycetaceae bacterium]
MHPTFLPLVITLLCLLPVASAGEFDHFERKIRPLLSQHCYECHSSRAKTVHGGLKLDSASGLQKGGDSGEVINTKQPDASLLLETIHYEGDIQMPPTGKLPDAVIAELTAWVRSGAPFPPSTDTQVETEREIDIAAGRQFWSFQPVTEHSLPETIHNGWPQQRLDSFVLAAMEREGLSPSPPADKATLIRRLYFDVIGLPPTPEQVQEFVTNESPAAFEDEVDRLLQSPHYGEKWARMWLDKARYTDVTASWLYMAGQAHLYRDWVVQAFNDDMPYNDFVHRQLATDLMPETGPDDMAALGFLGLSPTYWKELKLPCEIIKVIVADEWEERVDAVSKTFLGLTVACARCHDHKFDPIRSEDYYALAGIFASTRLVERPVIPLDQFEPVRKARDEVAGLEAEIAKLKKSKDKDAQAEKIAALETQVRDIKAATPLYDTPMVNAVSEESMHVVRAGRTAQDGTRLDYRPEPQNLPLFVRGDPNRPGPEVPRKFPAVLSTQPRPFEHGSGRLELAQAITTDAASLAARVIVNRIWLAHFGQGIVSTPSNFGQQGSRPTHPELLDDLAARFIANGWSIKTLHREILLSATWQQSSAHDARKIETDPDNRWLSRMNRRRLDFEEWRDAMLLATGELDRTLGGPPLEVDAPDNRRRTLYGKVHRRDMSTTLQIHDFPDPTQHSPRRSSTTTALQGLYALNGPLLLTQSAALVNRLQQEAPDDTDAQIARAYWLLYSRAPTERERELGQQFLTGTHDEEPLSAWKQYAHVLLAANESAFVD